MCTCSTAVKHAHGQLRGCTSLTENVCMLNWKCVHAHQKLFLECSITWQSAADFLMSTYKFILVFWQNTILLRILKMRIIPYFILYHKMLNDTTLNAHIFNYMSIKYRNVLWVTTLFFLKKFWLKILFLLKDFVS